MGEFFNLFHGMPIRRLIFDQVIGRGNENDLLRIHIHACQRDRGCGISPYGFEKVVDLRYLVGDLCLFELVECEKVLFDILDDVEPPAQFAVALCSMLEKRVVPKEFDELFGHQCAADRPETCTASAAEDDICHTSSR